MQSFSVSARGLAAVQVQGNNWIQALGLGLAEMGRADEIQRLACEVLQNGTVIARDITTGTGFIVQQVHELPLEDTAEEFQELELMPFEAIVELDEEADPLDAILDADTPRVACQLALTVLREAVPAESSAVILEERGYLRFTAVSGPHARKLVGVRLPLGTGVAGFSMVKRRVIVLADAHDDPRHCGEVDALTGYVTKEIAVVPILHANRILGVLEVMNLTDNRRFTQSDVQAAERVAVALAERLAR